MDDEISELMFDKEQTGDGNEYNIVKGLGLINESGYSVPTSIPMDHRFLNGLACVTRHAQMILTVGFCSSLQSDIF